MLVLARQYRGYTRRYICDKIGLSRQQYRSFECLDYSYGRYWTPAPEVICELSELLDFPVSFFYEDDIDLHTGIISWVSGNQLMDDYFDEVLADAAAKKWQQRKLKKKLANEPASSTEKL